MTYFEVIVDGKRLRCSHSQRGILYEYGVLQQLQAQGLEVYHGDNLPVEYAFECGLLTDQNVTRTVRRHKLKRGKVFCSLYDFGTDLIIRKTDGSYILVQCKDGYAKGLYRKHVIGIVHLMYATGNQGLLISSEGELKGRALASYPIPKLEYQRMILSDEQYLQIASHRFPWLVTDLEKGEKEIRLHDYQKPILEKLRKHFEVNGRGILVMPCRTGKTIVSCSLALEYEVVVLVSPLKQQTKQNLDRFLQYTHAFQGLIIDSDEGGTTDSEEIRQFLTQCYQQGKKPLLSVTYASIGLINLVWKDLQEGSKRLMAVVDEFHNLSGNSVKGKKKDDLSIFLRHETGKIMFMSATPRIYDLDENSDCSLHGELFGGVAAEMQVSEAVEKGKVSEVKYYLPDPRETEILQQRKQDPRVEFILTGLEKTMSRKCIVYCEHKEDVKWMEARLKKLDQEKYYLRLTVRAITCDTSAADRKRLLEEFEQDDRITIMLSVRILDEGVDLPTCDSIYLSYPTGAKARLIQRTFRCRTVCVGKNHGRVFLWGSEWNQWRDSFVALSEDDPFVYDKTRTLSYEPVTKKNQGKLKAQEEENQKEVKKVIMKAEEWRIGKWEDRLKELRVFMNLHGRRPKEGKNPQEEVFLAKWVRSQMDRYRDRTCIMKQGKIRKLWEQLREEYPGEFIPQEEKDNQTWNTKFQLICEFAARKGRFPVRKDGDFPPAVGGGMEAWLGHQRAQFIGKKDTKKGDRIMKEERRERFFRELLLPHRNRINSRTMKMYEAIFDHYDQTGAVLPLS